MNFNLFKSTRRNFVSVFDISNSNKKNEKKRKKTPIYWKIYEKKLVFIRMKIDEAQLKLLLLLL